MLKFLKSSLNGTTRYVSMIIEVPTVFLQPSAPHCLERKFGKADEGVQNLDLLPWGEVISSDLP